jgi:hypothetical protein
LPYATLDHFVFPNTGSTPWLSLLIALEVPNSIFALILVVISPEHGETALKAANQPATQGQCGGQSLSTV